MRQAELFFFAALFVASFLLGDAFDLNEENKTRAFLEEFNVLALKVQNDYVHADWESNTNITEYNTQKYVEQSAKSAEFKKAMRLEAMKFNLSLVSDDSRRQLQKVMDIGTDALEDVEKLNKLTSAVEEMTDIFSTAEFCIKKDECYVWDTLSGVMSTSRDPVQLEAIFVGWRNATGKRMRKIFEEYVDISNEAVRTLGYKDTGESWRAGYTTDTYKNFEEDLWRLFNQIRPLYEQLHAYVRKRLKAFYETGVVFPASGHIPAHLLGDIYAQEWSTVMDIVAPYQTKTPVDVTQALKDQKYTVTALFRKAEAFFMSLGFDAMVPSFWTESMLEKPTDREVVCHGSAWDFYNGTDFRIKMCTKVTEEYFRTVHHEMGHVQYYMHYKHLPKVYRRGANQGFHEAVGDLIALSVQTPEHLKTVGLMENIESNNESDMNFLMRMALNKIPFYPFGYLVDRWRYDVFRGDTTPDRYNSDWWNLRCAYQGVSSPIQRSEDDFDPGSKYHVASDTGYMRYFVSYVIQFQFHKAACDAAGHKGPLHKCDIYNSTAAGQKIGDMLSFGASTPWPEVMKNMTGEDKMSAEPLLEYFEPLMKFLREQNGDDYGWDPVCPKGTIVRTSAQTTTTKCAAGHGERIQVSVLMLMIASLVRLLI